MTLLEKTQKFHGIGSRLIEGQKLEALKLIGSIQVAGVERSIQPEIAALEAALLAFDNLRLLTHTEIYG